jgi:hypothetical protein
MPRATAVVNQIKQVLTIEGRKTRITMMLLPQERRVHHRQAHGMLLQLQQQTHM